LLSDGFAIGPNPVGKRARVVNFFRTGGRVENSALYIYDALGNAVGKVNLVDDAVGTRSRRLVGSWNLTGKNGRPMPDGQYLVKGVIKASGEKIEKVSAVMSVRRL
jgi:hypothetical protein